MGFNTYLEYVAVAAERVVNILIFIVIMVFNTYLEHVVVAAEGITIEGRGEKEGKNDVPTEKRKGRRDVTNMK